MPPMRGCPTHRHSIAVQAALGILEPPTRTDALGSPPTYAHGAHAAHPRSQPGRGIS
ncbi:hypothetical protein CHLRE_17g702976v5 [Chlamydomonas reinhardtii]|uniref:Uncharacterized protein n=1 Tax=Chlamydomonas reinhardtii TaxID=3055 RepID=A0A2K3CP45_CHLRE|nr:uncharacterized protein CHLRE_17g702976v5 [Chlamydomonas reinhardtii]PNW70033.1 hypothetical protein CHLRE_17g702976v5 [Chlamydomonas reinhardtii]